MGILNLSLCFQEPEPSEQWFINLYIMTLFKITIMKYHNNNFMVEWSPQHEELYVSVVRRVDNLCLSEDPVIIFYDKNMPEDVKSL